MNILREVRRVNNKSMPLRIILLLLFSLIFIVTTYAWFSTQKDVRIGGLIAPTNPWDVAYYINEDENEYLDQTVTFTIDELYPGMAEREDTVHVYNMGSSNTQIYYELISVKVFGVEVLNELKTDQEIQRDGNTTSIFSTDTSYPFDVSYTYDRSYLKGEYVDDETTPEAHATFHFNVSWPYEEGSTAEELTTKDILDTKFGKDAYTYYQNEENDSTKAIEIHVRITSKMIHPSLTSDIELQDSDVTVEAYGKDGEGIVVLTLKEEYAVQGYNIEYVALSSEESFDQNVTWTQGDMITGLSETDTLYIRITDGTQYSEGILTINLTDLFEKYTDTAVAETTLYTDPNGDTAYIPEGFKIGDTGTINTVDTGLVIEDESGNQFVWVPVEDAVYNEGDIPTSSSAAASDTTFYRPMARYQSGSTRYYEGMFYTFVDNTSYANLSNRLGSSNYSEPRLVTNYGQYTWDIEDVELTTETRDVYYAKNVLGFKSGEEFGKYMNEEYTNMVNSVKKYGGFYVSRYEVSLNGEVAQSKTGQNPMYSKRWDVMYKYLDSNRFASNPYYNSDKYVSSMIWNSQWNAMLNWILTGSDAEKINDQSIGNLSETKATTGSTFTDCINNIYDLTGNVGELVQAGNSSWTKTYRGSSIYSTDGYRKEGTASNIYYIDSNGSYAYIGTRMTLYIKDQTDTTVPTIEFRDTMTIASNSIKVRVDAQDDSSGIKKYTYSISSNGGTTYTDYEGWGNTYTFEGLTQNTTYNIKVKVYDHAGNSTEITYPDGVLTGLLEVSEGDIALDSLYGKDGAGIAYLEIAEDLEDEGYGLEYQLIGDGETFSETGTWTSGQQISNLSVGDTIYARVTDGINIAESSTIYTCNISELETFSTEYTSLTEYTDANGDTAYIPSGFKVGTSSLNNTIESGLVIENVATGDQFVWVPVEHAIYNSADGTLPISASTANQNTDSNGNVVAYKPMVKYQSGYTSSDGFNYFEGIAYTSWGASLVKGSYAQRAAANYALGASSYREPSLITESTSQYTWKYTEGTKLDASSTYYSTKLGFDSATEFGEYMNDEYTNMILSVDKYGGFYVGRYETSVSGTVAKSQYNKTPMASTNWYNMYYNQDSKINTSNPYYGNTEIVASMIWGSQWDAMLNWILDEGVDAKQVYTVTGNHSGSRRTTGVSGNDFANNVIDISANVMEWTQEANGAKYRVCRGGDYYSTSNHTASTRDYTTSTYTGYNIGSRFTLYIK